jgi:hypothetical protein
LTKERVGLLNELGFSWDVPRPSVWESNMKDLLDFKEQNGHVHVPLSKTGYTKLAWFVRDQRRQYALFQRGEPSLMTPERVKELEAIGFCWDAHEASWQERYHELIAYKLRYDHCLVPEVWPENQALSAWVYVQRCHLKQYMDGKRSTMTEKHIAALREIGFSWKLGSINRSKTQSTSQQSKKRKMGA